ncbi:MAG: hypothetical protein K0U29_00330 [Gammaproteobacteria bacterium]|nr:hypothetical protein [Gammaproteobacteria bacterium]MCH9743353.1 hypothetical protein [Gammaproteobacteria bacterium]
MKNNDNCTPVALITAATAGVYIGGLAILGGLEISGKTGDNHSSYNATDNADTNRAVGIVMFSIFNAALAVTTASLGALLLVRKMAGHSIFPASNTADSGEERDELLEGGATKKPSYS